MGRYKLDKIECKTTGRVVKKKDKYYCNTLLLVNPEGEGAKDILAEIDAYRKKRKTILVCTGLLKEDEKGRQTLVLARVAEIDRSKR